jgi:hypothetical protein
MYASSYNMKSLQIATIYSPSTTMRVHLRNLLLLDNNAGAPPQPAPTRQQCGHTSATCSYLTTMRVHLRNLLLLDNNAGTSDRRVERVKEWLLFAA